MTASKRENEFVPLPSEDGLLYAGRIADLWSEIRCGEAVWTSGFEDSENAPPSGLARSDALSSSHSISDSVPGQYHNTDDNKAFLTAEAQRSGDDFGGLL
jgi:hypothetical protein